MMKVVVKGEGRSENRESDGSGTERRSTAGKVLSSVQE